MPEKKGFLQRIFGKKDKKKNKNKAKKEQNKNTIAPLPERVGGTLDKAALAEMQAPLFFSGMSEAILQYRKLLCKLCSEVKEVFLPTKCGNYLLIKIGISTHVQQL